MTCMYVLLCTFTQLFSFCWTFQVVRQMMWLMDHIFKYTNFGIVSLIHGDFFIRQVSGNTTVLWFLLMFGGIGMLWVLPHTNPSRLVFRIKYLCWNVCIWVELIHLIIFLIVWVFCLGTVVWLFFCLVGFVLFFGGVGKGVCVCVCVCVVTWKFDICW